MARLSSPFWSASRWSAQTWAAERRSRELGQPACNLGITGTTTSALVEEASDVSSLDRDVKGVSATAAATTTAGLSMTFLLSTAEGNSA
jgi:hypothetical protein